MHKTLVLPDIHTPLHHEPSIRAVLPFIKYYKPDRLMVLGDLGDFNSLGRFDLHYPEDHTTLDEEMDAVREMLDRIEAVCPKNCDRYYIGGNHEDRWHPMRVKYAFGLPYEISRTIREMPKSWGIALDLDKRGWGWCEYGKVMEFDKIVYKHGKSTAKMSCAKIEAGKHPGKNVIFGHTHRRQVAGCINEKQQPIESECIGTLSRFDLSYLRGEVPTDWVHMFMFINTNKGGAFNKYPVHIIDGKFISPTGREF